MTRKRKAFVRTAVSAALLMVGLVRWSGAQQQPQSIGQVANGNGNTNVFIEQKLNAQVPLDTELRDENNQPVKFGDYVGKRPAILIFPFYKCPGTCLMELDDMTHALNEIKYSAGKDFDVIVVSIDSTEMFTLAQAKKRDYLENYKRPGAEKGWHFLTGPEDSIQRLTKSVGFHFTRDPQTNQISHPIGLMFLTSEGKVSHYLFGLPFATRDVNLAMVDASDHRIGTLREYVSLLCSHYDTATGRYGVAIDRIIKIASAGTILILGGFIFAMFRLEKRRSALDKEIGKTPSTPTGAGESA